MYSISDLNQEISDIVESQEQRGVSIIHPDWVTTEIMSRHACISGEDADFYTCLSRVQVRSAVRNRINRYKEKPEVEADPQMVMPGFERLQKRYVIKHDGEMVAIRVQDMTPKQRKEKAQELRRMGEGCYQHADELERYNAEVTEVA